MERMADPEKQDGASGPGAALRGAWVLVAGPDAATAARLRGRLADLGAAAVELAEDAEDAAGRAAAARPDVVLALHGLGGPVRERLDPVGLGGGPPVVALDDLPGLPGGTAGDDAVLDRLGLALDAHRLRLRVRDLEAVVASGTIEAHRGVAVAEQETVLRLTAAAGYRDDNTWEHTQRVAAMAARLGRRVGLGDLQVELIRAAAPLHDVGKIAVPDSILLKPDRLTAEEFEVIKTHAAVGASILEGSVSPLVQTAQRIARAHHERWDGGGYPDALAGEAIPVEGRLVAVADVFDILVHERPYKEEWSVDDAAEEIRRNAGTQFDPDVVAAFDELGGATWKALASDI